MISEYLTISDNLKGFGEMDPFGKRQNGRVGCQPERLTSLSEWLMDVWNTQYLYKGMMGKWYDVLPAFAYGISTQALYVIKKQQDSDYLVITITECVNTGLYLYMTGCTIDTFSMTFILPNSNIIQGLIDILWLPDIGNLQIGYLI